MFTVESLTKKAFGETLTPCPELVCFANWLAKISNSYDWRISGQTGTQLYGDGYFLAVSSTGILIYFDRFSGDFIINERVRTDKEGVINAVQGQSIDSIKRVEPSPRGLIKKGASCSKKAQEVLSKLN